jgi:hypothetical protein
MKNVKQKVTEYRLLMKVVCLRERKRASLYTLPGTPYCVAGIDIVIYYALITLLTNLFILYTAIKFWLFETVSIWGVSSCRFLPVLPKNCFLHRQGRRWRRQYIRFNYWCWSTNTQVLICQKLILKLIFMLRGHHFWYSELCVWLIAWFLLLFILGQREVLCGKLWTNLK